MDMKKRYRSRKETYNSNTLLSANDEIQLSLLPYQAQLYFSKKPILAFISGCLPYYTEFMTEDGWKRIDQYRDGDKVLQYNKDTGESTFCSPEKYICKKVDKFVTVKNQRVDFKSSISHNHLVKAENGAIKSINTMEMVDKHLNNTRGNRCKLISSFNYDGEGIKYTDDQIRVAVMVMADGHFQSNTDRCIVRLKKKRKIERIRELLKNANIEFKEKESVDDYMVFTFNFTREKEYESYWYRCSNDQMKVVAEECMMWDGSITNKKDRDYQNVRFSSTSKKSADFIQFCYNSIGFTTAMHDDVREGRTTCYGVSVYTKQDGYGISKTYHKNTTEMIMDDNQDQYMYCFTVPDSYFVVRQKDKIYVTGNTGCGKSYFTPFWLWQEMLNNPGFEHIISAPTISMLKRTVIRYTLKFFTDNNIIYTYNKSDMVFDLPHATVYAISAEDSSRLQGIHAKSIISDEGGLFSYDFYQTAVQRLAFNKGRHLITTTPYSANWLKTEIYDKAVENPDGDIELVNVTSLDNPFYPKEEFERARAKLPEWKFNLLFLGKFDKPEGLVYPHYEEVEPFDIPEDWDWRCGADFGWNDPFALTVVRIDPETEQEYLVREVKKSKLVVGEIAKILMDIPDDAPIYCDPAAKHIIETLKQEYGLWNCYSADNSKMSGILNVNERLKTGKLKVFSDLMHTKDELETYSWKVAKEGDQMEDTPVKKNDHIMDSLKYNCSMVSSAPRIREI